VATKLTAAAAASVEWTATNGVAFDQGKTEAAPFRRGRKKKKNSAATVTATVGGNNVQFNKEATWWLGVWLDAHLTLKDHHAIWPREGSRAMTRLRRLTWQMGLSPANCRKVVTACVQSVAMFC